MADTYEPMTQLIADVSRMNGMLERALTDHGIQLTRHENELGQLEQKTASIDAELSGHKSDITNLKAGLTQAIENHGKDMVASRSSHDKDISDIKTAQTGQLGKVFIVVGPILAGLAILISILRDVYIP